MARAIRTARPWWRGWLGGGGVALLGGCALMALAGQSARIWPRADPCNYLLPLLLPLGLAGLAAALAGSHRQRAVALLAAAVLVACGAERMGPDLYRRVTMRLAPAPADLRLIQFNLLNENVAPGRTAAWIAAQRPDVAIVEEASGAAADIPAMLSATLPFRAGCFVRLHCSTMILSRRPFLDVAPLGRGDPENHQGRSLLAVTIMGPGGPYAIFGLHLDHPWPHDRQEDDLAALQAQLARARGRGTIVAGDFNMVPWSVHMARQDRAISLPRLTQALATWPARWVGRPVLIPLLPIDHVYAGAGWRPVRVTRGPMLGSDHRPVLVDLRWTDPRRP